VSSYSGVYEGKGAIHVKFFFRKEGAPEPARILIYTIPPGASEGVHIHQPGDTKVGSFDEFYYIISGSGEMEIEGETVPVTAGDHVFIPNGVAHGIENTSATADLKVYLLAVMRD
jgi:mannose-6-phosphate isomerase-like protein (cupin superfamily)